MSACPRCARPAAVAGPRCLYCGAALPDAAVTAKPPPSASPPEPRMLVIADARDAPAAALAAALGLTPLEAVRRAERGTLHLLRVASPAAARDDAARLGASGIRTWLVDEDEARAAARPRLARGGRLVDGVLSLQVDGATVEVGAGDVLLVVRGPIQREYQSTPARRRVRAATLEGGYRVHLHRRPGGAPLELDPGDFEFTEPDDAHAPSLLVVSRWADTLAAHAPVDDEFRRLPPALAPAAPSAGALGMVETLRPTRASDAPLVLDNLAQFRFYSAWRGVVERQRR
jgi:hypothetical protein